MRAKAGLILLFVALCLAQAASVDWTGTWIFKKASKPIPCGFKDNKVTVTQIENDLEMEWTFDDLETCGNVRNAIRGYSAPIPSTGNTATFGISVESYEYKFLFTVDGDKATITEDGTIEFEREKSGIPFFIIIVVLLVIILGGMLFVMKKKKDEELSQILAADTNSFVKA